MKSPTGTDDHFGLCPKCHAMDGFVNAGRSHFVFCKVHKLYGFVGANLFSSCKEQTEEEQRKIWEDTGMDDFEEVKPSSIRAHRSRAQSRSRHVTELPAARFGEFWRD